MGTQSHENKTQENSRIRSNSIGVYGLRVNVENLQEFKLRKMCLRKRSKSNSNSRSSSRSSSNHRSKSKSKSRCKSKSKSRSDRYSKSKSRSRSNSKSISKRRSRNRSRRYNRNISYSKIRSRSSSESRNRSKGRSKGKNKIVISENDINMSKRREGENSTANCQIKSRETSRSSGRNSSKEMDERIPIRRSRRVAGLGAEEGKDKDVSNESGDEIDHNTAGLSDPPSNEELEISQQSTCKKIIFSPVRDAKEKEKAGKKNHNLLRDFQI